MADKFNALARAIKGREIRLPDFQRGFSWSEANKQRDFIASVLMAMPLGSILLLEAGNDDGFCCRKLGGRLNETEPFGDRVQFLIDGQQRVTVLMMAFSDIVYDINYDENNGLNDLADASLSKRFFLSIPRRGKEGPAGVPDVFHFGTLDFPHLERDGEDSSYISETSHAQMQSIIESVEMKSAKGIAYKPNGKTYNTQEIKQFVNSPDDPDYYRIPLFVFGEPDKNRASLRAVFEELRTCRIDEVIDDINEALEGKTRDEAIAEFKNNDCLPLIPWDDINWENESGISESDIDQIRAILDELAQNWTDQLKDFLNDALKNLVMAQTEVCSAQKERAIEIFSIINTNATNLTSFDLMVAIAGAADNRAGSDFRNAVVSDIKSFTLSESDYYYCSFPETFTLQPYADVRDGYIKSLSDGNCFGALTQRGDLTKEYQKAFGKVLVFLNALNKGLHRQPSIKSIIENRFNGDATAIIYKDAFVETSYQLLSPNEIAIPRKEVVQALNHAGYFFQAHCGVKNIGNLNYKLQYPLVACVLYYMDWLLSSETCKDLSDWKKIECVKQVSSMLEAWYWISAFSLDWHSNQNTVAREDLTSLLVNVYEICVSEDRKYNFDWISPRRSSLLDSPRFSKKEFLIREGDNETDRAPEGAIKSATLQFLLSRGLPDLLKNTRYYYSYSPVDLEIHHLLPVNSIYAVEKGEQFDGDKVYGKLGSGDALRSNDKHRFNSPCNFTYAEKNTNTEIGTTKVSEYLSKISIISSTHCVPAGFSVESIGTKEGQMKFLGDRFDALKTEIEKRINGLCGTGASS